MRLPIFLVALVTACAPFEDDDPVATSTIFQPTPTPEYQPSYDASLEGGSALVLLVRATGAGGTVIIGDAAGATRSEGSYEKPVAFDLRPTGEIYIAERDGYVTGSVYEPIGAEAVDIDFINDGVPALFVATTAGITRLMNSPAVTEWSLPPGWSPTAISADGSDEFAVTAVSTAGAAVFTTLDLGVPRLHAEPGCSRDSVVHLTSSNALAVWDGVCGRLSFLYPNGQESSSLLGADGAFDPAAHNALAASHTGVWIAGDGGLYDRNGLVDALPGRAFSLSTASDGRVWIASKDGGVVHVSVLTPNLGLDASRYTFTSDLEPIAILHHDHEPELVIGTQFGTTKQLVSFEVSATDEDVDPITFFGSGLPANATLSSNGSFAWTPSCSQSGEHVFLVSIRAGHWLVRRNQHVVIRESDSCKGGCRCSTASGAPPSVWLLFLGAASMCIGRAYMIRRP